MYHVINAASGPHLCLPYIYTFLLLSQLSLEIYKFMLYPDFIGVHDARFITFLLQTKSKYAFAISGTGHCGMEAMVFNMVEPGDVVLVADHGIWGERFSDLCLR